MGTPETATLSGLALLTITAAARAMYPYDLSLDDVSVDDVYARAKERPDKAAGGDFAAPGTVAGGVMVVARGQRRDLR